MPFYPVWKRRGRYRFRYGGSRYRRKKKGNRNRVYRGRVRKLQTLLSSVETKFHSSENSALDMNTTGTFLCLNYAISQGTAGPNDRIGNKVSNKKLHIKGVLDNTHGTPADCVVRFIVIRYKRPQGTALTTIAQLFDSSTTTDITNALYDTNKLNNFKIYLDKRYPMDTALHSKIPFSFNIKLNNTTVYTANTPASTDIDSNALYLVLFSTDTGTTNDPLCKLTWRVSYTDL